MKKSLLIAGILYFGLVSGIKAQDIHFSQIGETPLLRNPALAGLFSGDFRVQSVFRSQWNGVTEAYKTVSSNMEFKLPAGQGDDFITLGAQVLYDKAGTTQLSSTHVLPVLNYHKSLSSERSTYLSMAAMAGVVQRSIDRSKITTNSQYNGGQYTPGSNNGETFLNNGYKYFDATVGISFSTQLGENTDDNMYAGVAYHHVTKPKNVAFYSNNEMELAAKTVISAGVRTRVQDGSYLTIEADHNRQKSYSSTILGVIYTKKLDDDIDPKYLFHVGGYYRLNDAVIPVVKLEAKPISIAISYDANISQLKEVSNGRGGFEMSLTFQKYNSSSHSSGEAIKCPKF